MHLELKMGAGCLGKNKHIIWAPPSSPFTEMLKDSDHVFSRGWWEGEKLSPPLCVNQAAKMWSNNDRQYLKTRPLQLASSTEVPGTVAMGLSNHYLTTMLAARLETIGLLQRQKIGSRGNILQTWKVKPNTWTILPCVLLGWHLFPTHF